MDMSQLLLRGPSAFRVDRADHRLPRHGQSSAGDAARGIMLALALSSLGWIALALLVPRLW